MDLSYEYFESKAHITDLQNLKDCELYPIIRLFRDELENFNKTEGFKLKGLIIACDSMKDLIKNLRFIINVYNNIANEENIIYPDIKDLLTQMDKIEIDLKKIKDVRRLKNKVNLLVDCCLLNIRVFYCSLSDFILLESHLWEA